MKDFRKKKGGTKLNGLQTKSILWWKEEEKTSRSWDREIDYKSQSFFQKWHSALSELKAWNVAELCRDLLVVFSYFFWSK